MDIWSLCCICNCNLFTYPAKTPHSRHSKRVIHIADIKLISWCLTQSKYLVILHTAQLGVNIWTSGWNKKVFCFLPALWQCLASWEENSLQSSIFPPAWPVSDWVGGREGGDVEIFSISEFWHYKPIELLSAHICITTLFIKSTFSSSSRTLAGMKMKYLQVCGRWDGTEFGNIH